MMDVTVGVFDSGFGGLTVLRELLAFIPNARYIYIGDTARLPYGSKSRETIARYALSSAHFLQQRGAEIVVVACNTASALALDDLRAALSIPVLGVIEPGTEAAVGAAQAEEGGQGEVLVLATQATVDSHAYARTCAARGLRAYEKACPLLVPLVEEGWTEEPRSAKQSVTGDVLRIYLSEALQEAPDSRAALLGCTHYPLLRRAIEQTLADLGHPMPVVDSAHATARTVARMLGISDSLAEPSNVADSVCDFFATDSVGKFARLGSRFLGRPVQEVKLVDLGG